MDDALLNVTHFLFHMFKEKNMLTELTDLIKNLALRHKGVRTFRYQDKTYNNAQNNHLTYQVYLADHSYHKVNITTNVFVVEYELYVLGQPDRKDVADDILKVQDDCYTIINNIIAKLGDLEEYKGIVSIYDYDIVVLSHYSDDDSAGVKCSLSLRVPNPVSLCDLDENFNDDPFPEEEDDPIDVPEEEVSEELTINPIKLPKNPC